MTRTLLQNSPFEKIEKFVKRISPIDNKDSWYDYKWQLKHAIRDVDSLENALGVNFSLKEKATLSKTIEKFPMSITPYYLSQINIDDYKNDPIFKQAVPCSKELIIGNADMVDPLSEDKDSPVKGITHRYPDRILFHISNKCAMYCRHCTRKRKVGDIDFIPSKDEILEGIEYIKIHLLSEMFFYLVEIPLCFQMIF